MNGGPEGLLLVDTPGPESLVVVNIYSTVIELLSAQYLRHYRGSPNFDFLATFLPTFVQIY